MDMKLGPFKTKQCGYHPSQIPLTIMEKSRRLLENISIPSIYNQILGFPEIQEKCMWKTMTTEVHIIQYFSG